MLMACPFSINQEKYGFFEVYMVLNIVQEKAQHRVTNLQNTTL